MARIARRGLLPVAIVAVAALFALFLAAIASSAGARSAATQSKLRTRVYRGTSSNNTGATMLVKAKVNRRGIPREVTLVRVTGGKMECWLDPATGFSTVEPVPAWTYSQSPVPVTVENNGRYRNIRGFLAVRTDGNETPHHLGEEEFTVSGRFALNGKRANVNFGRAFVTEGSAVGSSEESTYCSYHGLFHITPVGP
jgi:hypothetical protein